MKMIFIWKGEEEKMKVNVKSGKLGKLMSLTTTYWPMYLDRFICLPEVKNLENSMPSTLGDEPIADLLPAKTSEDVQLMLTN